MSYFQDSHHRIGTSELKIHVPDTFELAGDSDEGDQHSAVMPISVPG
jgi:hypothetical protein